VPKNTPAETATTPIDARKKKAASAKTDADSPSSKPLFDPMSLTSSRATVRKTQNRKTNARDNAVSENSAVLPDADNSAIVRQRVVITDNLTPEKIAPCSVYVNEENISLLNGGGVLGVSVGINKKRI
jgi:hypothetical protein